MKDILANCVRQEPWVWLRRLIIIESGDSGAKIVRDIPFTRGFNIVWAKEPDDEDVAAEISGHSAGKTSLCRLIRYLLGEKQFATKNNTRLIGKAFPEGYVGAELFIRGKQWAVIRPLKKGRNSYIKPDTTLEDLLADRSTPAFEHDYADKIGLSGLLDDLPCATIVETGQQIKWEHVLAWCMRDQEARFQDVFAWRSPRSESDWPAFQHPKSDPLFLMRVTLGLFLPEELKKEEDLGKMGRERELLEKKVNDLEKEPTFRVNLYDRELRNRLKLIFPAMHGVDDYPLQANDPLGLFPDLQRTTDEAVEALKSDIAAVEGDRKTTQDSIDDSGGKIRELEGKLLALSSLVALDAKAQTEISGDPSERERIRKQLDEAANAMCTFGDVLFSDCSYIKARRDGLKKTEIQDAHAAEQNEARRAESLDKLKKQKENLIGEISTLKTSLDAAKRRRDGFLASLREKREQLRDLNHSLENLKFWTGRKSNPNEFKELNETRVALKKKGEDIAGTELELNALIQKHNANYQTLTSIFSTAVKRVLPSGTYDGQVSLSERQLAFSITHGASMTGEAVETLAVLLADLSCLIYNALNDRSNLPGVLLHDSPREADLGKRLYWSFLNFAASLQSGFTELDQCPFQYILTTTTEPPKGLRSSNWIKLQLNASKASGLLFGRNIADAGKDDAPDLLSGSGLESQSE